MVRAAFLTFSNEFRLLGKDRIGIFMLLLAPVVIIAVAGFSLGNLYGVHPSAHAYVIPVVNQDGGAVGAAIIAALEREPSITVARMNDLANAQGKLSGGARTPLAILIPAGASAALAAGQSVQLALYVDSVRRLEVSAIEVKLGELCREVTASARGQAQRKLAADRVELHARLEQVATQARQLQAGVLNYQREMAKRRENAQVAVQRQLRQAQSELQATLDSATRQAQLIAQGTSASRDALLEMNRYLSAAQSSQAAFEQWFAKLSATAGAHRVEIPPPPAFPVPPSPAKLTELSRAVDTTPPALRIPPLPRFKISFPKMPPLPNMKLSSGLEAIPAAITPVLPGDLTWRERSITGDSAQTNAFDQYVPGFGITFLLIGMLMGIGLGLIDERDWGTLQRLQVSGAPLASILAGKVVARFVVGLLQMIVLFALGWFLFGISLGREPWVLLVPTAAICFAGAAFGLVVACIARTHDSVMPFGAVAAMAMSAIGGCWWPLDFEPSWMRAFAQWLPTTWAMQAYNNLMIRQLGATSMVWPSAATVGLGLLYLGLGFIGARRLYQ